MGDNTLIEWADTTWNFLSGCTKVSDGCLHCYIERTPPFRMAGRRFDQPGIGGTTGIVLRRDRLGLPLRWRKPRRVFVNSLADLFHEAVEVDVIAEAFAVMSLAARHTFQVLTKRHARMKHLLGEQDFTALVDEHRERLRPGCGEAAWPLPNVWAGVSVETQKWADIRIPALLATPAAVRWISAEPLLGPLSLDDTWLGVNLRRCGEPRLDWVVTGGESGPAARPPHPTWFRVVRDQCEDAGVAYFHKQHGDWAAGSAPPGSGLREAVVAFDDGQVYEPPERLWAETPPARTDEVNRKGWALVHRAGKKAAGRALDGREHLVFPEVVARG